MRDEPSYDSMGARELKSFISSRGFTHSDCKELPDLRRRAREAGSAGQKSGGGSKAKAGTGSSKRGSEGKDAATLRERKKGSAVEGGSSGSKVNNGSPTDEEESLKQKVAGLQNESGQVIFGRDASVILADVDHLRKVLEETRVTPAGREQMVAQLDEVQKSLAFEDNLEQNCGRIIRYGLLAVTIIPLLLSGVETSLEYAMRPTVHAAPANLIDMHAVVTGGCGAVGLELAIMLANSGAEVIVSCHGSTDEVEAKLSRQGILQEEPVRKKGGTSRKGWIKLLPLQLESFASVREFAGRVLQEWNGLDILVHNAATKGGCSTTEDGHELSTQVNYLSPFLLTQLLLPVLREGAARVVHVTCDAALQRPDWLPWPLTRSQAELLPRVDLHSIDGGREPEWDADAADADPDADPPDGGGEKVRIISGGPTKECSPLTQYANAKLAAVVHSHELNRRLPELLDRGVSHVVNPGTMDNPFGRSASVPEGKRSMRSSFLGNLPMVWIASGVYNIYKYTLGSLFSSLSFQMYRSTKTGAKAVFHVATAEGLGNEEHGGGLFSDAAGAFLNCGRPAEQCGRLPASKQPAAASDEDLAAELWSRTEGALGRSNLRPLRRTGAR